MCSGRSLTRWGCAASSSSSNGYRAFEVRSADPRFASALIDAAMIDRLLGLPPGTGLEIHGSTLLAISPRPTFDDLTFALQTMHAFRDRIPPVVASLYGH